MLQKWLKDNKDNRLYFAQKYGLIFVLGYYLFHKAHSFPQATAEHSWKTVCFLDQIMPVYKYLSL